MFKILPLKLVPRDTADVNLISNHLAPLHLGADVIGSLDPAHSQIVRLEHVDGRRFPNQLMELPPEGHVHVVVGKLMLLSPLLIHIDVVFDIVQL